MSPGIVPSNLQHTTAPLHCFSQARPRRTAPAMKHGSAYPGDHHARSKSKIIYMSIDEQSLGTHPRSIQSAVTFSQICLIAKILLP